MKNVHSHLTLGPQITAIKAERDAAVEVLRQLMVAVDSVVRYEHEGYEDVAKAMLESGNVLAVMGEPYP